mmetsp:Transcript_1339/g.1650  ORF Transcript_1339/g.1650 Transcript_1339/m.1650 type:complete len:201 (+) Transcript_1339:1003-1605(+)
MNACLLRSSVGSFVALNFIVLLRSICMASNALLWSFGSSMPNVSSGFLKTGWRGSVSGACRMVLSASCRSRSLWISKSSSLPMRVFEFRRWRQLHSDRLSLFHVVPMMGWRISHGAPVADCWAVCFTEFSHSALSSVLRYPPPPNAHFRWNLSLVKERSVIWLASKSCPVASSRSLLLIILLILRRDTSTALASCLVWDG